ncbi:MAG: ABC transporter permease [Haloarculaceae archaeon]
MAAEESTATVGGIDVPPIVKRLLTNPKVVTALVILIPVIVLTALGKSIAPHDPLATHPAARFAGLGGKYPLGTDNLGRDLLSRTIVGGQKSLLLGFGAAGVSLLFGVPIGLFTGYVKGRADELLMRLMDIMMSIPVLLLGILLVVALGSSLVNVVLAVGIVFTPRIARVTRSATLSESEEPYVLSAKARGESTPHILFREILPNVTAPIVVEGSIRVGYAILIGTSLSFLGLGAGPPHPDWGFMISQARVYMYSSPWYLLWPSVALVSTIMAMNLLGDGLRDVLDPRTEAGGRAE